MMKIYLYVHTVMWSRSIFADTTLNIIIQMKMIP